VKSSCFLFFLWFPMLFIRFSHGFPIVWSFSRGSLPDVLLLLRARWKMSLMRASNSAALRRQLLKCWNGWRYLMCICIYFHIHNIYIYIYTWYCSCIYIYTYTCFHLLLQLFLLLKLYIYYNYIYYIQPKAVWALLKNCITAGRIPIGGSCEWGSSYFRGKKKWMLQSFTRPVVTQSPIWGTNGAANLG